MTPGEGLFSLRLPKFESYQPGMLNSPAAILRQPTCAQHQAKSLPQLHVGNAAARTRTVSAAPFRLNRLKFPGNTGGLRSQRIPQFESDHPSHAVQSRRRHFRAWKNARSVAPVPLALRVTNFVAVAVIVTGAVCVSARVRSRRHRWAPNLLQRTAAAPLAITDAQASRQGRRSDNHHDCRAEKQFLHDALPWPRANSTSTGPITVRWWG